MNRYKIVAADSSFGDIVSGTHYSEGFDFVGALPSGSLVFRRLSGLKRLWRLFTMPRQDRWRMFVEMARA